MLYLVVLSRNEMHIYLILNVCLNMSVKFPNDIHAMWLLMILSLA